MDESVIKGLTITTGVICLRVPSLQGQNLNFVFHILNFLGQELIDNAIRHAKENKICAIGDNVIAIQSVQEEEPENSNILKILTVS